MDVKTISVTINLPLENVNDFVGSNSRFVDWPQLSNDYAEDVSLDFIRAYQHRFVWLTLLKLRIFPELSSKRIILILIQTVGKLLVQNKFYRNHLSTNLRQKSIGN